MIFKAEVENQLEETIKVLISDRGGEYTSYVMFSFREENDILHEFSVLYTPGSNGVTKKETEP